MVLRFGHGFCLKPASVSPMCRSVLLIPSEGTGVSNPFIFNPFRTLLHNEALPTPLPSIASALFPSQWGGVYLANRRPPFFRIFFHFAYTVSLLFATLTKTAGVYPNSSHFGSPLQTSAVGLERGSEDGTNEAASLGGASRLVSRHARRMEALHCERAGNSARKAAAEGNAYPRSIGAGVSGRRQNDGGDPVRVSRVDSRTNRRVPGLCAQPGFCKRKMKCRLKRRRYIYFLARVGDSEA